MGAIFVFTHGQQQCNFLQKDCICDEKSTTCVFNLIVEQIQTFASYGVENNYIDNLDYQPRGKTGGVYYFDSNGNLSKANLKEPNNGRCANISNEDFSNNNCSTPITVDGMTYRSVLTLNGLIPGPNLIVYEGQTIVAYVTNMLSSDTISIHWHGMNQRNTPWMDGVGGLSHCPITPGTTFTYIFKASPSGTFWYHSHSGTQRTDGLFGALIVKEKMPPDFTNYSFQLSNKEYTLSLLDWQQQASEDLFTQLEGSLGFFPGLPIGRIPQNGGPWRTYSADGAEVGPITYWSGLINGRGRHASVSYNQSRLTIFNVNPGISSVNVSYRFRMIGAQSLFAYRISISDHKLTIIATDGYLVKPVDVDYIIIHSGERYDFALKPKYATEVVIKKNYLIRAETLEVDLTKAVPYPSLGHIAEAILHYGNSSDQPSSTMYFNIAQSYNLDCLKTRSCVAINCPFINYNQNYNITQCIKITDLQLLLPTPDDELPGKPTGKTIFFNFGFQGDGSSSAINGRNFILPSMPPQTQGVSQTEICQVGSSVSCSTPGTKCRCTHLVDIPESNKYVEFVFSAVGVGSVGNGSGFGHPVHLHGHSFQVVDIGYGKYDTTTGIVNNANSDISCLSDDRCSYPGWTNSLDPFKNISITEYTIRKDTIIVPAGGYARVWIIADNPGYWFLHCHIESHQMEGMSVIINELPSKQNCPPSELALKCGDFKWNVNSFNVKVKSPRPCSYASSGWNDDVKGLVAGLIVSILFNIAFILIWVRKKCHYQVQNNTDMPMKNQSNQPTSERPSVTDMPAATEETPLLPEEDAA